MRGVTRHHETAFFLVSDVADVVRKECRHVTSTKYPSVLRGKTKDDLLQFSWKVLLAEKHRRASTLLAVLSAAAESIKQRRNQVIQPACVPFIGMAAAILLKCRNKRVRAAQHITSLVMNAGHCSTQV